MSFLRRSLPSARCARANARAVHSKNRTPVEGTESVEKAPQPDLIGVSGCEALCQALKANNVDMMFGYPGGAILPLYDELTRNPEMTHVLVRHEQGAAHMAEGWARSLPTDKKRPGVVVVTSGPGLTNCVTGITDALCDSTPLVVISGQVGTMDIGTRAFQECPSVAITKPVVKKNWMVKDVNEIYPIVNEAFRIAMEGRHGPVLVDFPRDVQRALVTKNPVPYNDDFVSNDDKPAKTNPGTKPSTSDILTLNDDLLLELVQRIEECERPVLYTGGGLMNSVGSAEALQAFADEAGIPTTSTLMGLGAYPAHGKNWLGMLGMFGIVEANKAMQGSDLMLALGARFDDRIMGYVPKFSPGSYKVCIDLEPGISAPPGMLDMKIKSDVGIATKAVLDLWRKRGSRMNPKVEEWRKLCDEWRGEGCLDFEDSSTVIKPQRAIQALNTATVGKDVYFATDVGQHQMWAAQYLQFLEPNRWMTSGGLGTMGYGLPASIGIQVAHPESLVINVTGECSFWMCMQELGTAVQYNLPVKQFLINNNNMGMVRQWQELLWESRYSHVFPTGDPDPSILAKAYGMKGIMVEDPAGLNDAIEEMIEHPGPVLLDVKCDELENLFPWCPPGSAHNEMLLSTTRDTVGGRLANKYFAPPLRRNASEDGFC